MPMNSEPSYEGDAQSRPERAERHEEFDLSRLFLPEKDRSESPMALGIESDRGRFKQIVRDRIREDLKKYMTSEDILSQQGGETVKVPIPRIVPPHFEHSSGEGEGVGQGEGEAGDKVDGSPDGEGNGQKAGQGAGEHITEELTIEELGEMLADMLKLPRIEPKGSDAVNVESGSYNSIAKLGPDALRHPRRTLKEALLRQIASGEYDPENPDITPVKDDFRYKSFVPEPKPESNAAIIYVMDVSGSMETGQKEIARMTSFWIDVWLRSNYDGVERVFIIHDTAAKEVDEKTFFTTSVSGGTEISSAYELVVDLLDRFPPEEWNLYLFQFSDGDNFSSDNVKCTQALKEKILPYFNQVAYGQIGSQRGWGTREPIDGYYEVLNTSFKDDERVVLAPLRNKQAIPETIKKFFSAGR